MLRRGVKIQRRNIHSLEEAADIIVDGGVHCVVNATGLGASLPSLPSTPLPCLALAWF